MKQLEPHITVRAVQPVVAGLQALGHDAGAILARAPIRRDQLEEVDGRVPPPHDDGALGGGRGGVR